MEAAPLAESAILHGGICPDKYCIKTHPSVPENGQAGVFYKLERLLQAEARSWRVEQEIMVQI